MMDLGKKIWMCTLFIISFGLIALYSATFENVRVPHKIFYDQMVMALLAILVMFIFERVDYRKFYDATYVFYFFNVLLLVFVLVSGRHALGARRWLEIGDFSFQPSEIAKFAVILLLGRYYSDRSPNFSFNVFSRRSLIWKEIAFPLLLTGVLMFLIFKQPDLGTSILLFGIFLSMLIGSGIHFRYVFTLIGTCLVLAPFGWHFLKAYQRDRLLVFLNPNIDPLGAGYTIIQSKIAVGSGQILGKGWLAGTQNQLNFLPERHTDFIFSVIGEEWGLFGTLLMLGFYFILIQAGLQIADQVKDRFGMLVTLGIVSILTLQVIINIGMVIGLFPVVGITLPLVSYGRTSFLMFAIMIGFLLNLSRKRLSS